MPCEMKIKDIEITKHIFAEFTQKFSASFSLDVAIVGGGPSGLTAARYLAQRKKNVAVFERKLSPGGGMWGGGMAFPVIVIQEEGKKILEELGVNCKKKNGYFTIFSGIFWPYPAGSQYLRVVFTDNLIADAEKIGQGNIDPIFTYLL